MPNKIYDFVVIGSGFAGSIMSMVLRRIGKSVLMIERAKHPRFAIGESSTPFANLLLEKIAEDYDLPFLKQLSEWGSWRHCFPELPVGLKRGFTFFHHKTDEPLDFSDRTSQLLVAASPNDDVADTHWYRPEFDAFLVKKAVALSVEYRDGTDVKSVCRKGQKWEVVSIHGGEEEKITAGFVLDAGGGNGCLARHLSITNKESAVMPKISGVWAHFEGVGRLDEMTPFLSSPELPYPPDDAAVHHVFDGGWVWVLKFNNGITSAGVAFSDRANITGGSAETKWNKVLQRFPSLRDQFRSAAPVTQFYESERLSFIRKRLAGENWALLPSAAGFVDPLLSTGFALTLRGIIRFAEELGKCPNQYAAATRRELEAVADLVSALYAKMNLFDEFALLTLLYFSAMSFSETLWRLGKSDQASSFLLANNNSFSAQLQMICKAARTGGRVTRDEIQKIIEPYDVAGLTDWSRRNWHPVDLQTLFQNAGKCGATETDIAALIQKLRISTNVGALSAHAHLPGLGMGK